MFRLLQVLGESRGAAGSLSLRLLGRRSVSAFPTTPALQLANFWQDVAVDLLKDRVYIPLEAIDRHGYTVEGLVCAS